MKDDNNITLVQKFVFINVHYRRNFTGLRTCFCLKACASCFPVSSLNDVCHRLYEHTPTACTV